MMIVKEKKLTDQEKLTKALEKNRAWKLRSALKVIKAPKKPVNNGFYGSAVWRNLTAELREKYLINVDGVFGWVCVRCGVFTSKENRGDICVAHVLPRAEYKHLALEPDNLVIFCSSCNRGYDTNLKERRRMVEYVKVVKGVDLLKMIDKSKYLFGDKGENS